HLQAGVQRRRRKAGAMLDAAVPFFLDSGDQLPVAHQRRGHVAVVGVEAENVHIVTGSKAVKRSRNRSSVNWSRKRARPRAPIASLAARSRSTRTTLWSSWVRSPGSTSRP